MRRLRATSFEQQAHEFEGPELAGTRSNVEVHSSCYRLSAPRGPLTTLCLHRCYSKFAWRQSRRPLLPSVEVRTGSSFAAILQWRALPPALRSSSKFDGKSQFHFTYSFVPAQETFTTRQL